MKTCSTTLLFAELGHVRVRTQSLGFRLIIWNIPSVDPAQVAGEPDHGVLRPGPPARRVQVRARPRQDEQHLRDHDRRAHRRPTQGNEWFTVLSISHR